MGKKYKKSKGYYKKGHKRGKEVRIQRMISHNTVPYRMRISLAAGIYNTSTTTAGVSVEFPFNHPTYIRNQANTWGQAGIYSAAQYATLTGTVFQQYRIKKMVIRVHPISLANNPSGDSQPYWPNMVYIGEDRNDDGIVTSENQALGAGMIPQCFNRTTGKPVTHIMRPAREDRQYRRIALLGGVGGAGDGVTVLNQEVPAMQDFKSTRLFFSNCPPNLGTTDNPIPVFIANIIVTWEVEVRGIVQNPNEL